MIIKKIAAGVATVAIALGLSLVGAGTAQAQLVATSVASPCVPAPARTVHHDAVTHVDYQRYSYNPKKHHPANPNDATPPSTPVNDPGHWQANTSNYDGAGHGSDPVNLAFFNKNPDSGAWWFWVGNTVVDHPAYDETIPAVTCSDSMVAVTQLAAICNGTPTYTDAQFTIANATWTSAIDNSVGTHIRTATAFIGHDFTLTNAATASVTYDVPASLGTTQSTNRDNPCYQAPSTTPPTVTYETVVWAMPSWVNDSTPTYGPNGQTTYSKDYGQVWYSKLVTGSVKTLDVSVPQTCGTQYQVDIYVLTNGEVDNTAKIDAMFVGGLHGPNGAQDGPYLVAGGNHVAWKLVKNADCINVAVAGNPTNTDQLCTDSELVGGVITVVVTPHVSYQITDSTDTVVPFDAATGKTGPLATGTYTVAVAADTGYKLTSPASYSLTITGYDGVCQPPLINVAAAGDPTNTNQLCTDSELVGGVITVFTTAHVSYQITGPNGAVAFNVNGATGTTAPLAPGNYTVAVAADAGYKLTSPASYSLTITGDDGVCQPPLINVAAAGDPTNTNQLCTDSQLVGGVITVFTTAHVSYQITGPNGAVAFNVNGATGTTAPLAPGNYTVAVAADAGYKLTSPASYSLTITGTDEACGQLVDHPIVTPVVTFTQLGCTTAGSYTLANDLNAPTGVIWTVDGSPVAPGTYSVTSARTVKVHADPNGPNYGFSFGQQQDWTLTFVASALCATLPTLALHDGTLAFTGSNPTGLLVLAGLLGLLGLALILARRLRTLR